MTLEQLPCENAFRTHVDVPFGACCGGWRAGTRGPRVLVKKRLYVYGHTSSTYTSSRASLTPLVTSLESASGKHACPCHTWIRLEGKVPAYPTGSDAAKCSRAPSSSAP
jgi:hypothetical protein